MVAIYARQSVERKGSVSIATQIDVCRPYVNGEAILYTDVGFSGKNMRRPRLKELIRDCKEGYITEVYVYKLDRISRSLYDFARLMELFTQKGIRFVSCTEWFDTHTPMGRAMLSMAATFAQLERETISQRVADVYAKQCRMGAYMGGQLPLGFQLSGAGGLEIHAEEIKVVKALFEKYATGSETYRSLSNWCNEQGYVSKRKRPFFPARIGEILRNPIYVRAGEWTNAYAKEQGITFLFREKDHGIYQYREKPRLWVSAPHIGVIKDEEFVCVQYVRQKRFGEALRITQEHLDSKNFYAFNPEMDV